MLEYVRAALDLPPPRPPSRSITQIAVIPRIDTRRFINLEEMVGEIQKAGYLVRVVTEMQTTGRISFKQQVLALWEADVVISAHGAQLSYVAFCRGGTTVLEIHPHKSGVKIFHAVSLAAGQRYFKMELSESRSIVNMSVLRPDIVRDLNKLREDDEAAYNMLTKDFVLPPPGYGSAGLYAFHRDLNVDIPRLLNMLNVLNQLYEDDA